MALRRIPDYSPCCNQPVLGDNCRRVTYCLGCGRVLRAFATQRQRDAAYRAITFRRSHCRVEVWLAGECIAYARDDPNLLYRHGAYRKVGRSTYGYFIMGSPLVSALGFQQCHYKDGFLTLRHAGEAMVTFLATGGE